MNVIHSFTRSDVAAAEHKMQAITETYKTNNKILI